MSVWDSDVTIAVQTELKLYLTQQLYRKGYLSDEMCANATELILKDAKNQRGAKKTEIGLLHTE